MNELTINALLTVSQLLVICIIGFAAAKFNILTDDMLKGASKILASLLTWCLLIQIGFNSCSSRTLIDIWLVFVTTGISQLAGFGIAMLLVKKKGNPNYWIDCSFAGPANAGFIGTAIISLMLGSESLVYIVGGIVSSTIIIWTVCNWTIAGKYDRKSILNFLKSPVMISIVICAVILITDPPIPMFVQNGIKSVGNMVGPVALLISGAKLAQTDVKALIKNVNMYKVLLVRHILAPLVIIPIFKLIPGMGPDAMTVALVISACPAPSMPVIFAIEYDKDAAYASGVQALSMVLVILTLPFMVYLYTVL